ncbi:MAG: hypothetical protein ACKVJF_10560 [Flavobacteriales bacterium]
MTAEKNERHNKLSLRAEQGGARQSHEWNLKRTDGFTMFALTVGKSICNDMNPFYQVTFIM